MASNNTFPYFTDNVGDLEGWQLFVMLFLITILAQLILLGLVKVLKLLR